MRLPSGDHVGWKSRSQHGVALILVIPVPSAFMTWMVGWLVERKLSNTIREASGDQSGKASKSPSSVRLTITPETGSRVQMSVERPPAVSQVYAMRPLAPTAASPMSISPGSVGPVRAPPGDVPDRSQERIARNMARPPAAVRGLPDDSVVSYS